MTARAAILGRGLAAQCLAARLLDLGWEVVLRGAQPDPAVRLLVQHDAAVLIAELLGGRPELFDGAHAVAEREVAWGDSVAVVAHPSILIAARELAERMERVLVRVGGPRLRVEPGSTDAEPGRRCSSPRPRRPREAPSRSPTSRCTCSTGSPRPSGITSLHARTCTRAPPRRSTGIRSAP